MGFESIAEVRVDPGSAYVYEEGWQSWSPAGVYRASATSPRPPDRRAHTMGWRPEKVLPRSGFQGEGVLAVAAAGEPVRIWHSPEPGREVASIRVEARTSRLLVSADGPVLELGFEGNLQEALAALGERLAPGEIGSIPPGWCSWSCYFRDVTEAAILENLDAAARLELPVEIVQVDDGYESGIGDWPADDPRFGSLRRTAERSALPGRSRASGPRPSWSASGAPSLPSTRNGSSRAPTRAGAGTNAFWLST